MNIIANVIGIIISPERLLLIMPEERTPIYNF